MAILTHLRKDYVRFGLAEADMHPDPLEQFQNWLQEALAAEIHEPYAMTLATVSTSGQPSARIVLLRQVDERGFTFFTNYQSAKGEELAANPKAALLFYWPELERQIRVEGTTTRTDAEISEAYFRQRPVGSQVAAAVSAQSAIVPSREDLEERYAALAQQYAGQAVPRPAHWGGYALLPHSLEFWQGRANRLHDRLRYRQTPQGWILERLSP
jgi:pyridoxamine 5'-phosphate oxidase